MENNKEMTETVEEVLSAEQPVEESDTLQENNEEVIEKTEQEQLIEKLQAENDALADKALRAQAELQNVQRRQAKERQDLLKYRSQKLAEELLPVLDNLERALSIEVDNEQAQALKKGIEMAYDSFLAALKAENIEVVEALNQPFDPMYHQSVQVVPVEDGQASDTVVQVFQKGYTLHDRVIRPAMVVVSQ